MERECLAVIWAISKFRPYIYGSHFTIVIDHALCWLSSLKGPSGRPSRWSLKLQDYDFTVVYKPADSLSRCPLPSDTPQSNVTHLDTIALLDDIDLADAQWKGPSLQPIIRHLSGDLAGPTICVSRQAQLYHLHDGIMYRRNYVPHGRAWLLMMPRELRREIIQAHHDNPTAGHLGFSKTYFRIRNSLFRKGMHRSVNKYVRSCHECQTKKNLTVKPAVTLSSLSPPDRPYQRVEFDCLGLFPLSASNNRWIIVGVDHLTRYAETQAVAEAAAIPVANIFVHQILLRHEAPNCLLSDRGIPFLSQLMKEALRLTSTVHSVTTAYRPQTNGLTERLNHTLADMMSLYVKEDDTNWDTILLYVTFAYNTARQATTGYSPYFLLYAREPPTILDTILPYIDDNSLSDFTINLLCQAEEARQLARLCTFESQQGQQLR